MDHQCRRGACDVEPANGAVPFPLKALGSVVGLGRNDVQRLRNDSHWLKIA
jgi:hypothetical protein